MRKFAVIFVTVLSMLNISYGQNQYAYDSSRTELMRQMKDYVSEMYNLGQNLNNASPSQLDMVSQSLNMLDTRWNAFFQSRYDTITADDELLTTMDEYEKVRTSVEEAVEQRRTQIEKTSQFVKSEQFITSKLDYYKTLKTQAFELSLVKQSAPLLEKLKAKEQLDFADIQSSYQSAKDAAEINPRIKERMDSLQDTFIEIQSLSAEIQQMEYKPLIARIKDYLMSLAAVSIIMTFFVFIGNYIKTFKSAKDSAKQMKELLHKDDNETPVI